MANGDKTILYVDKVAIDNYIAQGQYVFNTGVYKSVLFAGTTRYDAIVQDENTIISSSSAWYNCFNTGISISDSTEVVQINSKDYYKLDSYIRITGYTYSSGQKLFFAIGGDTMSSYVLAENDFEQTIVEFDYDLNKVTPDYLLWDVTDSVESLKVLYTEPPHKIISEIQYPDETIYDIKDKNALNKSQITNCLLEVPQRIKLELNDGTLTLKAGSVVIVPNGFEADGTTPKFDYVTVESDLTTIGWATFTGMVFAKSNKRLDFTTNAQITSGNSATLSGGNVWYDTVTNTVKRCNDSSTWTSGYSFPICLATSNGSSTTSKSPFSSIDQIFNGMGYIGSTVWVDKGVKGLAPNGRNEDGTLNNVEFITDKLITTGYLGTSTLWNLYIMAQHGTFIGCPSSYYYVQETQPAIINQTQLWYKPSENMHYYSNWENTSTFNALPIFNVCDVVWSDANTITSLNPKFPFRAVDYNDFTRLIETWKSEWFTSPGASKSVSFNLAGTGMNATNAPHIFMEMIGKVVTVGSGYAVGDIIYPQFANYNGSTGGKEEGQSVFFRGNTLTYAQGNSTSWVGTKATGGQDGVNTANIQIKIILRRFSN